MDQRIIAYLTSRPDLLDFVRKNPVWYRLLSRNPQQISDLEQAAKIFYGKTFTQKLETIHERIQMASMLIQFAEMMKD